MTGIRKLDVASILGHADPAAAAQARATALAGQLATEERKRDRLLAAFGDMDDPALAARVRDAAEHVARLKKEAAEAEKAAGLASHAGGGLADRVALVVQLADKLATLEGEQLADLRTALAQELRRILVKLRFTPFGILADYKVEGRSSATCLDAGCAPDPARRGPAALGRAGRNRGSHGRCAQMGQKRRPPSAT